MADPILDFTTEPDRQIVRIDGINYVMRGPRDLGFAGRQRAIALCGRLRDPLLALVSGRPLPKAQEKVVAALLRESCQMAIDAPLTVIKRLNDDAQIALALTFFERSAKSLQALSAMLPTHVNGQAGTNSSPGSPGSTVVTPSTGRRSRSASSTRT